MSESKIEEREHATTETMEVNVDDEEMEDSLVPSKEKVGLPPGTLLYTGKEKEVKPEFILISFKDGVITENRYETVEMLLNRTKTLDKDEKAWITVVGMNETKIYELIQNTLNIQPLFMEDVLNVSMRPKMEIDEDMIFFVAKHVEPDLSKPLQSFQVGMVLTPKIVLSFLEKHLPRFDHLVSRIIEHLKKMKDYSMDLVIAFILDHVVDNYYLTIHELEDLVEDLEDEVINNPTFNTLQRIQQLKRRLMIFRRVLVATRDLFNKIQRIQLDLIPRPHLIYFSDIHDHVLDSLDSVDNLREILFGLTDLYMSSVSNKANDIMKVLTIIATIFIPHTFIVGWYGMNFKYMPEYSWPWAYPLLFLTLVIISLVMIIFFRKKGWM